MNGTTLGGRSIQLVVDKSRSLGHLRSPTRSPSRSRSRRRSPSRSGRRYRSRSGRRCRSRSSRRSRSHSRSKSSNRSATTPFRKSRSKSRYTYIFTAIAAVNIPIPTTLHENHFVFIDSVTRVPARASTLKRPNDARKWSLNLDPEANQGDHSLFFMHFILLMIFHIMGQNDFTDDSYTYNIVYFIWFLD